METNHHSTAVALITRGALALFADACHCEPDEEPSIGPGLDPMVRFRHSRHYRS